MTQHRRANSSEQDSASHLHFKYKEHSGEPKCSYFGQRKNREDIRFEINKTKINKNKTNQLYKQLLLKLTRFAYKFM